MSVLKKIWPYLRALLLIALGVGGSQVAQQVVTNSQLSEVADSLRRELE